MSTRIHWAGEDGHRSCTHGRTATHREVSAAEFLRLSNLCRTCERVAQKTEALSVLQAFGAGKPTRIPAPQWPEPRPIEQYTGDKPVLGFCPSQDWLTIRPDRSKRTGRIIGWLTTCPSEAFVAPTHFLPLPPKPEVRK